MTFFFFFFQTCVALKLHLGVTTVLAKQVEGSDLLDCTSTPPLSILLHPPFSNPWTLLAETLVSSKNSATWISTTTWAWRPASSSKT